MVIFPNAKINLGLRVLKKRTDGYHDLESVFYPVSWCDCLEFQPADRLSFAAYGIPIPGSGDNLCLQVYKSLEQQFDLPPLDIHLLKAIPIGAGLGGGSADAAFFLKALVDYFSLSISIDDQLDLLGQLGSDCPFFWYNRPMLAQGRGEVLSEVNVDLEGRFLLLLFPNIHISTAEAYSGVKLETGGRPLQAIIKEPVESWKAELENSFEHHLFERYPMLSRIKVKLYEAGAVYASMTGSGSTIYGIFNEEPSCPAEYTSFPYKIVSLG